MTECQCGCKEEIIPQFHHKYYGTPKYIHNHHNKGKSCWWNIKEVVKERSSRERAVKKIGHTKCYINNKDCKGRLEIHHIDKNPFNNGKENITCLCITHHRLCDKRNITPKQLKNMKLEYYVDKSGKRRYKQ